MFTGMLNDRECSGPGRDNVVTLLTRNIPRTDMRREPHPARLEYFKSLKGIGVGENNVVWFKYF